MRRTPISRGMQYIFITLILPIFIVLLGLVPILWIVIYISPQSSIHNGKKTWRSWSRWSWYMLKCCLLPSAEALHLQEIREVSNRLKMAEVEDHKRLRAWRRRAPLGASASPAGDCTSAAGDHTSPADNSTPKQQPLPRKPKVKRRLDRGSAEAFGRSNSGSSAIGSRGGGGGGMMSVGRVALRKPPRRSGGGASQKSSPVSGLAFTAETIKMPIQSRLPVVSSPTLAPPLDSQGYNSGDDAVEVAASAISVGSSARRTAQATCVHGVDMEQYYRRRPHTQATAKPASSSDAAPLTGRSLSEKSASSKSRGSHEEVLARSKTEGAMDNLPAVDTASSELFFEEITTSSSPNLFGDGDERSRGPETLRRRAGGPSASSASAASSVPASCQPSAGGSPLRMDRL